MDKQPKKCKNECEIYEPNDSHIGFSIKKGKCGDENTLCESCTYRQQREQVVKKTHYCGKQKGSDICQADDSKEYNVIVASKKN